MSSRIQQVTGHLAPTDGIANKIGIKSPEDVVIVSALRSAITRARKGGFKDTLPEEILAGVFKAMLEKTKINPAIVNDICVGGVLPAGGGATHARMAALYAGFPEASSVGTVNRQCSSGLQAVVQIATAIQTGLIEVGIGAGVESMTKNYGAGSLSTTSEKITDGCQAAADCLIPMG
jgi:acetyl-CoA acyltransferase 1